MKKPMANPQDVRDLLKNAEFSMDIGYFEILEDAEAQHARFRWPHIMALAEEFSSLKEST